MTAEDRSLDTIIFSGLMSEWTSPFEWDVSDALANLRQERKGPKQGHWGGSLENGLQ